MTNIPSVCKECIDKFIAGKYGKDKEVSVWCCTDVKLSWNLNEALSGCDRLMLFFYDNIMGESTIVQDEITRRRKVS